MGITLKHLQEEMNMKSEVIRKQNEQIQELRDMLLQSQAETQRCKNQIQLQQITQPNTQGGYSNKENESSFKDARVTSPVKYIKSIDEL